MGSLANLYADRLFVSATLGAAGLITVMGMYYYQKKRKDAIPTNWEPVGEVKSMFLYPLKSGRRMEITTAECTDFGFQIKTTAGCFIRDRCLIVYQEATNEYKTAKHHSKMVLVEVIASDRHHFAIKAPGMHTLRLKIPDLTEKYRSKEIFLYNGERASTVDCGDEAALWISNYILGKSYGLRLGFHNGLHRRDIEKFLKEYTDTYSKLRNSSTGMYSDMVSFAIINQASVDELNSKLPGSAVTVHHFRPNIVVEGPNTGPCVEDNWDWIKIGDAVFRNVKPCARCIFPNIDPETGVRSPDNEPLKTLKTYRKVKDLFQIKLEGDDPVMGIYLGLKRSGQISVGDTVYVVTK